MQKILILLLLVPICLNAQIGIGTTTPNPSSALDISATDAGILIPRMTEVERDAILSPATGLLIYQTDGTNGFYYWDGAWTPFAASSNWIQATDDLYNNNTGNVGIGTPTPTTKLHVENIGSATVIIDQGFESTLAPFTTGGDANWALQTTVVNSGASAARSGTISGTETSFMEYNVTIPVGGAPLSFFYSVSSEANFDFLRFSIDGTQQDEWSGNISYTQQSYNLTAGAHTLRWWYEKDASVNGGADAAYIDDVTISSSAPPALRIVDGNEADGSVLISDASGNATWQQLTAQAITDFPDVVSFSGMEIPICNTVSVGSTGNFFISIKGVPTTVSWQVLSQQTTAGSVVTISGMNVLAAPQMAERLQVRYNFSPALPFTPNGFIFSANNRSAYPDTFSLNYADKSATSLTMNITRTDTFGNTASNCWAGQFYFDVFMTD